MFLYGLIQLKNYDLFTLEERIDIIGNFFSNAIFEFQKLGKVEEAKACLRFFKSYTTIIVRVTMNMQMELRHIWRI